MKVPAFVGCAAALLVTVRPRAQASPRPPVNAIEPRDFSADLRNFNRVQHLLHNLRSRIGVPFSAMQNVGLAFQQTLEVQPLDLVLLPTGYCFSCSTSPHNPPDQSKSPDPFRNEMVELDESQLLVACTDNTSDAKPDEWPLMKACPGQERLLREFLTDVCNHGSRLAVPKARVEKAPIFQIDKRICMPMNPKQINCSTTPLSAQVTSTLPPSTFRTERGTTGTLRDRLQDLISSMSQYKSVSGTITAPSTASSQSSNSTTILPSISVTNLNRTNHDATLVPTSTNTLPSSLVDHPKTMSTQTKVDANSTSDHNSTPPPHEHDGAQSTPRRKHSKLATTHNSSPSNPAVTLNSIKDNKVLSSSSTIRSIPVPTKPSSKIWSQPTFVPSSKYPTEPWDPNDSDARRWSAISAYMASLNAAKTETSQVASSTAPDLDDDEFFYPRVEPFDEEDHRKAISILLAWRSSESAMAASISSSIDHRKAMSVMGAWQSSHEAELNAVYAASAASAESAARASVKRTNIATTTSALRGRLTGQRPPRTAYVVPRTTAPDVAMETSACTFASTDDEDPFLEEGSAVLPSVVPTETEGSMITPRAVCHFRNWDKNRNRYGIYDAMGGPPPKKQPYPTRTGNGPMKEAPYTWEVYTKTVTGTETAHWDTLAHLNHVLSEAGLPTTTEWVTTLTQTWLESQLANQGPHYFPQAPTTPISVFSWSR